MEVRFRKVSTNLKRSKGGWLGVREAIGVLSFCSLPESSNENTDKTAWFN